MNSTNEAMIFVVQKNDGTISTHKKSELANIIPGLYVKNQQVTRNEHGDYELYEAFKKYATDINQSLTIAVDPFRRPHPQNMQPEFFNFYEPCRIIINIMSTNLTQRHPIKTFHLPTELVKVYDSRN